MTLKLLRIKCDNKQTFWKLWRQILRIDVEKNRPKTESLKNAVFHGETLIQNGYF